jgi:hypothetical protein
LAHADIRAITSSRFAFLGRLLLAAKKGAIAIHLHSLGVPIHHKDDIPLSQRELLERYPLPGVYLSAVAFPFEQTKVSINLD